MDSEFHPSQDMLFEILSRTTLETLDTCKTLNKELNELVEESWFVENYTRKTINILGYFVQTLRHGSTFSTFVSIDPNLRIPGISMKCFGGDDMMILASSKQGILCCRMYYNGSYHYYVCKSCTGQFAELPSPRGKDKFFERIALMILESNPFHYKIIRLSRDCHSPQGKTSYVCEIFDSKIWAWRQSENIIKEHTSFFIYEPSVCIGSVAYWLTDHNSILGFDSTTETHLEIPTPIVFKDNKDYQNETIVEYKGKLGFICKYKSDKILLWRLEDRRNFKWAIKRVVRIDKKNTRLIGCNLADMALMIGYSDQVYEQSGFYYCREIFPFRSDWEPVDLENGCMLSGLEEMMIDY